MPPLPYSPVFQLTRGGIVESVHYGAAAIVDARGRLLGEVGGSDLITFMRSSAKPFQALPFIERGGPEHFGFSTKETALICASHSGTDDHVGTAGRIQTKAGFQERDLQCGVHPPTDKETRDRMRLAGAAPTPNRHNCSGKHSGMLSFARLMGWPLDSYLELDHPVQRRILAAFSEMSDLPIEKITVGIDGCSAPNFALPLYNAALAYARLADPGDLPSKRSRACRTITHAMMTHPDMIAGPGQFDTCLMEAGGGRLFAKGGAEGYQGIGLLPGALGEGSPGIGIAIKISDGSARTLARSAVALEILRQLKALDADGLKKLAGFGPRIRLYNYRDLKIGGGDPCFTIHTPS